MSTDLWLTMGVVVFVFLGMFIEFYRDRDADRRAAELELDPIDLDVPFRAFVAAREALARGDMAHAMREFDAGLEELRSICHSEGLIDRHDELAARSALVMPVRRVSG